jgi:hypothetical protein
MTKIVSIVLAAALALLGVTASTSAKSRKAEVGPEPVEIKRSLFSGSESHLHNFGGLYADCTAPTTDVRIVKPPSKGEIRFEEARMVLAYKTDAVRLLCHGKMVDGVRMYYKANDNSVGQDTFLLDVDTKLGLVKRYKFIVDIR